MAMTLAAVAQTPTALWGKAVQGTLGTKVTSQGYDMKLAQDGGIYICGGVGTKTVDDIVRFGNEQIAAPATPFFGNGDVGNQSLFISKIAADGTPQWTVYSKNGHVLSANTFLQPVSDGLVAVIGIGHVSKMASKSIIIVGADGQESDLQWALATDNATRYNRFVVLKLSKQGVVQWLRQIDANPVKDQGLSLCGILTDEGGNIFLAGEQRADLYFPKADGTQQTVAAARSADFFLVKLDKNGYYQSHLMMEGDLTEAKVRAVQRANGHLYLMGTLTGADGVQAVLGGKALTLTNSYSAPFIASVNSDLSVNWAQATASDGQNFNMQQSSLWVTDNTVWLAGMASVAVTAKSGKSLKIGENMNRVGTLLKFDAANGDLVDGYLKPVFQTAYFSMFEDVDGYIYAAGYEGMLSNRRPNNGALYIDKFNPADLSAPLVTWDNLIQNVGGGQTILGDADGRIFTMTRSNAVPNALTDGTQSIVQDYAGYCCNICAFQLPVKPVVAGISPVTAESGKNGSAWYTLQGQRVERPTTKGLYIQGGRKVVVK